MSCLGRLQVYLLGGWGGAGSSSFLPTGSTSWEEGPLGSPLEVGYACAVPLDSHRFLIIGGLGKMQQVVEFDTVSSSWSQWPSLVRARWGHSCAIVDTTLVVAGGWDEDNTILDSTTLISLTERKEREGGTMASARAAFSINLFQGRLFALGGLNSAADESSEALDSVEVWNPEEEMWSSFQDLGSPRGGFSAASLVDLSLFCD